MVRISLFLILAVWVIGVEEIQQPSGAVRPGLILFLLGYALPVLSVAVWARLLSHRLLDDRFRTEARRLARFVFFARRVIPVWLAIGFLNEIGWGRFVLGLTGREFQSPALLLGTLPAFLAWVGYWWAEFPADRARREQGMLADLSKDLPVHAPPPQSHYLKMAVRQQLLPVLVPVFLVLFLSDAAHLMLGGRITETQGHFVTLGSGLLVYLMAPEIFRRLLNTRRLDDSPLRRRLESICRRSDLRYRDILLWQTDHAVANAAVIGILPRWRYVLLSDRLLETMSDQQIEAVFAHELGHIVHHHLAWFVVFVGTFTLAAAGPGQVLDQWLTARFPAWLDGPAYQVAWRVLTGALGFVAMLLTFGLLAHRFERQADVHAARMMQDDWGDAPERPAGASFVGERGATIYALALRRVAVVNDIPMDGKDLFHPSIRKRLNYLEELSADPARTTEFDRTMRKVYATLLMALAASGAFLLV